MGLTVLVVEIQKPTGLWNFRNGKMLKKLKIKCPYSTVFCQVQNIYLGR